MYPRSSLKPVQATTMAQLGLVLPSDLTALSAASHSGFATHVDGARRILAGAGLDESYLQCPADKPLGGGDQPVVPITMNCSGKHAAMLATCVLQGWDTATYLDPEHPLQVAIAEELKSVTGEQLSQSVDGCGAPLFAISLAGLARTVGTYVQQAPGEPGRRVVDAMRLHPDFVAGEGRDATAIMRAVPGLVAKDGAEGVYVAALDDGTALAFKISDGSERPRPALLAALLSLVGVRAALIDEWLDAPVLGGGRRVGSIRPSAALSR